MLFYEVTVRYQRQTGEEAPAKVKEVYLAEGVTPSDVEKRVLDEIKPLIFGECELPSIKKIQLYDILTADEGDIWYKGKVEVITVDDNGSEKRKAVTILVQAKNITDALKRLKTNLEGLDFEIIDVQKSPILELYRAVKE